MAIPPTQGLSRGPTRATIQFSQKNQGSPTEPIITKNQRRRKEKKVGKRGWGDLKLRFTQANLQACLPAIQ